MQIDPRSFVAASESHDHGIVELIFRFADRDCIVECVGDRLVKVDLLSRLQCRYGRFQMRIVSLRVFIAWDNFTVRRNLQDFPDRLLPQTRAMYGLRWTMWN